MFKWDGTNITDIIKKSEIYEAKYNKKRYWVIKHGNVTETCMVKPCKSSITCLIDELKPVFGLIKIGTHWFVHKGKMKILLKTVKTKEGHIKEEITLNQIEVYTSLMILQIQEIFVFRELLGITCSYESSIVIRESRRNVYPISFYEPNMTMEDKKIIPYTVLDKWFKNISMNDVAKRLLKIHKIDRLGEVLHDIRSKIDKVIERVDRRTISYKNCILNRITERLQTSLS